MDGGRGRSALQARGRSRSSSCALVRPGTPPSASRFRLVTIKPTHGYSSPWCHSNLAKTRRGASAASPVVSASRATRRTDLLMLRNVTSGSGATRARQTHRPDQGFNVGARRLADQLLGVGRDRLLVRQLRRGRVGLAPRAPGVQRDLLQLARLRRRDPPLVEGLDDELLRRLEVLGEGRCLSLNVAAQTAYSITSSPAQPDLPSARDDKPRREKRSRR
jgi:hypothetical protein